MYKIVLIIKKRKHHICCSLILCTFLLYSGWCTHIILFICEKPFSGFVLCVIYTLYLSVYPSLFLMCLYSPMTHNNKPEVWSYNNKNRRDHSIYNTNLITHTYTHIQRIKYIIYIYVCLVERRRKLRLGPVE